MPAPALATLHDTTRGWVARRLAALSGALLLPCPVRDGFLFAASPEFYRLCTESVLTLQTAARRVIDHLGLDCDAVVVAFRSDLPGAGRIERDGGRYFIEIATAFRHDGRALGAILAHECCHILVAERGVRRLETVEDEVHVDLTAMLAGLGALTLNGIADTTETRGEVTIERHRSFGYLRAPLLRAAYAEVSARLGLGWRRALEPLAEGEWQVLGHHLRAATRLGLRRLVRRPADLAYGVPESHVVVACGGAACLQRLRLPVGKRGTARCPACGHARRFDGRACRVTPRVAVRALAPEPPPRFPRLFRARAWWAVQPARLKAALLVVLLAIATPLLLMAHDHLRRGVVGAACARHGDCRSGYCMRGPARIDYCTQPCATDAECPPGLTCGDAQRTYAWRSLLLPPSPRDVVRMCLRR
ncbi:MAG TPA: hypothetical protein VGQ83_28785 [Polyangia bacterium]|jgi:hypothetical protein